MKERTDAVRLTTCCFQVHQDYPTIISKFVCSIIIKVENKVHSRAEPFLIMMIKFAHYFAKAVLRLWLPLYFPFSCLELSSSLPFLVSDVTIESLQIMHTTERMFQWQFKEHHLRLLASQDECILRKQQFSDTFSITLMQKSILLSNSRKILCFYGLLCLIALKYHQFSRALSQATSNNFVSLADTKRYNHLVSSVVWQY